MNETLKQMLHDYKNAMPVSTNELIKLFEYEHEQSLEINKVHEKENKELIATIELGYKEETKLIKEIQSLREQSLEQIKLLADMQDTNEAIATAYEDEKKENHYLKMQNLKHMTKKDTDDKIFMELKKDLEVLKHNLKIQDAMHAETLGERNRLEKSNYKMQGKNQKQGAKLLRAVNLLKSNNIPEYKDFIKPKNSHAR